jgi:hypothetical protein
MSEFSVLIRDKNNVPVGLIEVYLFNHEYLMYENGNQVLEWQVRSFPMKYKWIKQFGNLENLLNRYIYKERIVTGVHPDVIVNPVSQEQAIQITAGFSKQLSLVSDLWEKLAINWQDIFNLHDESRIIYMNLLLTECKSLSKSYFNHKHYNIKTEAIATIAWDAIIKNILFDNHIDYHELIAGKDPFIKDDPMESSNNETTSNAEHSGFISFKEILQGNQFYDSQFNKNKEIYGLSELVPKLMAIYEIDQKRFHEQCQIEIVTDELKTQYIFIPMDAERMNSGIYMFLKNGKTKHIYFSLNNDDILDFRSLIREYVGCETEDD